jgi:hypothetical protein
MGPSPSADMQRDTSKNGPDAAEQRDPEWGSASDACTPRCNSELSNACVPRHQPEWANLGTVTQSQARNSNFSTRAQPQAGIDNSGTWAQYTPGKIIFRDCQGGEVPEYLYQKFLKFFSHKEANKLAPYRDTDYAIDLKLGTEPPFMQMYNLSPAELKVLEEYIEKALAREWI